jgi:hypothetical protein
MADDLREFEQLMQQASTEGDLAIIEALRITTTARQKTYSHPFINFLNTAIKWSHRLRHKLKGVIITPYEVSLLMGDLKDARLDSTVHHDGIVDWMGYLSCFDRIALWLIKNKYAPDWETAVNYFDGWTLAQLQDFQYTVEHHKE